MKIDNIEIKNPREIKFKRSSANVTRLIRSVNNTAIVQKTSSTTTASFTASFFNLSEQDKSYLDTIINNDVPYNVQFEVNGISYEDNYYIMSDSWDPNITQLDNLQINFEIVK